MARALLFLSVASRQPQLPDLPIPAGVAEAIGDDGTDSAGAEHVHIIGWFGGIDVSPTERTRVTGDRSLDW